MNITELIQAIDNSDMETEAKAEIIEIIQEQYGETEIQIVAIETNIRSLLKDHPHAQQFIKLLQNEAIDNAFRELSERVHALENGVDSGFLETATQLKDIRKDVEILFGEIMKIYDRIETDCAKKSEILDVLRLNSKVETLEKHVEFLEKHTHHLAPKRKDV
jgi:tetrahydromethanopterin S-methyltransferase subunit G